MTNPTLPKDVAEPSSCYTRRTIPVEEAREAWRRFENAFWKREPGPRVGIPARPDYDDDLVLEAYFEQQAALATQSQERDAEIRRAAIEECAKIVEGEVVHVHYRQWPQIGSGNRSEEDRQTRLCDALAKVIRALATDGEVKT